MSAGLNWMDDIERKYKRNYDIKWPYYKSKTKPNKDELILVIGDSFGSAIGRTVNIGDRYHGAPRNPGEYAMEPDTSIEPDDPSRESGLEFVSPPLPVVEMLSDLHKVKAWADANDCYANESTGLHINVSVPGTATDKLDYVKLVLLLGDLHVLDQFGRLGNTYW